MAYFAVALIRSGGSWTGSELDLTGIFDPDSLSDQLRELAGTDPEAVSLLFVAEDDEWLGVLRVEGDTDSRAFISDARAVEESRLAALIYQAPEEQFIASIDDEQARSPVAQPAGDSDLLADLGVSAVQLLDLCAQEAALPDDIMTAICERTGCLEQLEELRGA
ncbi:MAG: tRNA adenosine deaminase-associated protein [Mycobacteriales bacterium]